MGEEEARTWVRIYRGAGEEGEHVCGMTWNFLELYDDKIKSKGCYQAEVVPGTNWRIVGFGPVCHRVRHVREGVFVRISASVMYVGI